MSSVMCSGGVQPVIIVRRRHEIIINLCVSHFGYFFRNKQNYGLYNAGGTVLKRSVKTPNADYCYFHMEILL